MKRSLSLAALLTLAAAAYAPLPSMAQSHYSIAITAAPPAPMYEAAPAPRRGYIWSPGHWEWRGHRHEWVQGVWIAERPGYAYAPAAWQRGDNGWYLEPARWTPYGRDRNYDGVPDRYETRGYDRDWEHRRHERMERERWEREHGRRWDEDHDGVPNRYDRDRDGDGVPNYRDRQPDNARRN
jgi:hypothetical protein